jgi:hypothetical protein
MNRMSVRTLLVASCVAGLMLSAARPASAQYRPLTSSGGGTSSVKGERYHIEFSGNLWQPAPDFFFKSEGLGIPGTGIDVDADLALEAKQMYEMRLVLRPAKKHKLRFHYLPMSYKGDTILSKDIVFNGQRFPIRIDVQTDFEWKAYRFTYEYDVIYRDRGYVGLLIESKYADAKLNLASRNLNLNEFVQARAPIPAIGLVGRVYPVSFVSISAEFSYFRLPDSVDENARFRAVDYDVYGTVNVTNNFGAQVGYRSIDMGFRLDQDEGSIKLKGLYFGGVVRF